MIHKLDSHTHTLASGHAYNTIMEMAKAAVFMGANEPFAVAGAAGSDRSCDGDAGDLPFFLFYEFAFSSAQHVRNRGTVWFRSKYYEL